MDSCHGAVRGLSRHNPATSLDGLRTLRIIPFMSEFLTVQEASSILQVSPRTIQTWIVEGHITNVHKLNPAKRNSPYRIPRQTIDDFIRNQNRFEIPLKT